MGLGDRGYEGPCDTQVEGEVAGDAPVVLNKGTEHLPTASGHGSVKRLIVNSAEGLPDDQIGCAVTGCGPAKQKITVLETIGHYIHLIVAEAKSDADIVIAANHVEGIAEAENVRSTDKWSETAISQRPIVAELRGTQAAAQTGLAVLGQSGRSVGTLAVEVGTDDPQSCRLAKAAAESAIRSDVVEDSIKARVGLVDVVGREDMRFRNYGVARVIGDELVAAEGILLSPGRRAAGDVGICLIISKPSEGGIVTGEVVVNLDGRVALVQTTNGNIGIVEPVAIRGTPDGIEIDHCETDWVAKTVACRAAGDRDLRAPGQPIGVVRTRELASVRLHGCRIS